MDYFNGGGRPCCYFHPMEVVVGICALCLKERLLILASKQGHHPHLEHKGTHRSSFPVLKMKPSVTLPRVFALGSFLHRLEPRPQRPDDGDSIASLEDSFISIKFEDNGRALWDKKGAAAATAAVSLGPPTDVIGGLADECRPGGMSVVERTKLQRVLRWRSRIAHLLQLARWKRSSKAGTCHVRKTGKAEGVKGRRGWIRSLTRRRTTSSTG